MGPTTNPGNQNDTNMNADTTTDNIPGFTPAPTMPATPTNDPMAPSMPTNDPMAQTAPAPEMTAMPAVDPMAQSMPMSDPMAPAMPQQPSGPVPAAPVAPAHQAKKSHSKTIVMITAAILVVMIGVLVFVYLKTKG